MNEIYILRHGETIWNSSCLCQGVTNVPLSKLGRQQAEEIAQILKKKFFHFDFYVSSNLSRAYDTCQIIKKILGDKGNIIIDNNVTERAFGELEGKSFKEVSEVFESGKLDEIKGFESNEDLKKRMYDAVVNLCITHPNRSIFIVSHSNSIKALANCIDSSKYNFGTKIPNVNLSKFIYDNNKLSLDNLYYLTGIGEDKTLIKE